MVNLVNQAKTVKGQGNQLTCTLMFYSAPLNFSYVS